MTKENQAKNIVIIGGGIGGLAAGLKLSRLNRNKNILITIIDKLNYHSFPPEYFKIITNPVQKTGNSLSFWDASFGAAFPFDGIFKNRKNIKTIVGEVADIDLKEKKIKIASSDKIVFDYLVIAPGSETNFFDNPNIIKYCFGLKTVEDALNIRNTVYELFSRRGKHEIIRIAIGGGGFTGCELAGELIGFLKHLSKTYGHPPSNIEIYLLDASKTILGGASVWIQKEAKKRLEKLGVKIMTASALKDVSENEIFLERGNVLKYDIFIWLAGVKANRLTDIIPKKDLMEKKGQIKVDEYLRLRPFTDIFVIGDAAYKLNIHSKRSIPMTAHTATEEGKYVAKTITRLLKGKKINPYFYSGDKFIIPLGPKYAILDFRWLKVSGWMAWFIRRLVILRYYFSIMPIRKAFKLWLQKM